MKNFLSALLCVGLLTGVASSQVPGTGRVKIKSIRSYTDSQPLPKPVSIVVYTFATSDEEVELNKAALGRLRTRIKHDQEDQKAKLAHKIAEDFAERLTRDLEKTGIPVVKGIAGEPVPVDSLAIQGDFLLIDEGNRARRMALGLGLGASKVEAHVECSVKQRRRHAVLTEFTATSESSRKPGAAETMGVGAAPEVAVAVSGATEMRQGAEGDTERLAKAVAKEIDQSLKAQGWIASPK